MDQCHVRTALSLLLGAAMIQTLNAAPVKTPETVMVTYNVRPGSEDALASVLARHWATARMLKLVRETPHTLVRGSQDGRTYFLEIFTWRDANTPDTAPAAIQSIWAEMNRLVESRGGRPGIDFRAVSVVGR